ncbi:uncharacterized protein BDZ83DRAFT_655850 [Colletotrichum acutatum]|uniref:F-box domain-containing protein n=1 Tax=Glomerella acutata TaxID=27357 RepID=A0AAD8XA84_GLOAC|nr:uncharacterized protein BDZ83DRAFT_655850 [Colletotrichum acutatum]KAK1715465.1 hypothetical protein BDZ83DRAFT_655850 [Colletotrichum acutatum]
MLPIRTEKSSAARKSGSLAAFFVKVDRNEALAPAIKVQPKAPKMLEAPQHVEPPPISQSATPPASSMTTTPTDSKTPPEEGDDVIELVTTDKVVLPAVVPQTVTVPSEPQPPKSTASSIQQLKRIRRPDAQKGTKSILFQGNRSWGTEHLDRLGSSTRQIVFGTETQLTPEIMDELISFPKVCRNLWHIEFLHLGDGYHPDNHARDLTDDTIVRLAAACPNLRSVKLRATTQLGHRSSIAFCQHCPGLKHLQITGEAANRALFVHEEFFDELARRPSWAPELRKGAEMAGSKVLPQLIRQDWVREWEKEI